MMHTFVLPVQRPLLRAPGLNCLLAAFVLTLACLLPVMHGTARGAEADPIAPHAGFPLEKVLGCMIMIGVHESEFQPGGVFFKEVQSGHIGHVLVLGHIADAPPVTAEQLRQMIAMLRAAAPGPFLTAVAQEGGRVNSLGPGYGVVALPSARTLGRASPQNTQVLTTRLGYELSRLGININLAPNVDVDAQPDAASTAQDRNFGADAQLVTRHAMAFAQGLLKAGVAPTLKYFPGRGIAHDGVAPVWSGQTDLKPYVDALRADWPGLIMISTRTVPQLDPDHPATLSAPVVGGLLRSTLGWDGVVISGDLQSPAIPERFSLEDRILLAVNAGVDILVFSNPGQDPELPATVYATLLRLAREKKIPAERIRSSWQRIVRLYNRFTHPHTGPEVFTAPGGTVRGH